MTYTSNNNLVNSKFLLEKVGISKSMHIADFGCGRTGHVVFSAAQAVGDKGIVYAVDILKDVLDSVRRRAGVEGISNIETIWGDIAKKEGVVIAPKTLDVVFIVNVLYNLENYDETLDEAARILKDKGKIIVADWKISLSGVGPSENNMLDFDKVISWAKKNNFVVQDDIDVGNYHRALFLYRHL